MDNSLWAYFGPCGEPDLLLSGHYVDKKRDSRALSADDTAALSTPPPGLALGSFDESGLMTGRWITWYPSGMLRTLIDYEDGLWSGRLDGWYSNGQPNWVGQAKITSLAGQWEFYYDTGVTAARGSFDGTWQYFETDGTSINSLRHRRNPVDQHYPTAAYFR